MVIYDRTRNEMSARDEDFKAAREEGVKFQFLAIRLKFNRRITGLLAPSVSAPNPAKQMPWPV